MQSIFRKAAMALAFTGLAAGAAPAMAHDHGRHGRHDRYEHREYQRYGYGYNRGYRSQAYAGPVWRGRDGRYYCRRDDGTTGLLIGAVVGGAIGHEVAGYRGDRTLGVVLGAAGGALLGRAIDRGDSRCR